jgi:hypothetical protein
MGAKFFRVPEFSHGLSHGGDHSDYVGAKCSLVYPVRNPSKFSFGFFTENRPGKSGLKRDRIVFSSSYDAPPNLTRQTCPAA